MSGGEEALILSLLRRNFSSTDKVCFSGKLCHCSTEIPCEPLFLSCIWLLAFRKSIASLVSRVVNKPNTQLTSNENNFLKVKTVKAMHARAEKPLLAG